MKRPPKLLIAAGIAFFLAAGTASASPTLREGSHGHEVLVLQQALQKAGYKIKNANGVFDKNTERAVAEFQRDNKINTPGTVNNATLRSLKDATHVRKCGVDLPPPLKEKKMPLPTNRGTNPPATEDHDPIQKAKA